MTIDILSDLHFDNYFYDNYSKNDVVEFYSKVINFKNTADTLVIAGDLGHYNSQNIEILKILKEYYKNIVCVLGNHEYFLLGKSAKQNYSDSFDRVKQMQDLINSTDGMYCLDGNIIEIDNIKFGGCNAWYNDGYLKRKYPNEEQSKKSINQMWSNCTPDKNFIVGIENYDDIFNIEKPKIELVYKDCDVMITHFNPSSKDEHMSERFQGNQSNTFFCFEGEEYLKNGNMKYWIFGHSHDVIEYEEHNIKCICNPFGYPNESAYGDYVEIRRIEIQI